MLPARLGGLGICDPSATSSECFLSSECITAPLVALVISQDEAERVDPNTTSIIKREVKKRNRQRQEEKAHIVYNQLTLELKRCMDISIRERLFLVALSSPA